MDLYNKREKLLKEIEKMEVELRKIEKEIFHNEQTINKYCEHKIVYKYVLTKQNIYTCKKCRNNISEKDANDKKKIICSFI